MAVILKEKLRRNIYKGNIVLFYSNKFYKFCDKVMEMKMDILSPFTNLVM